MDSSRGDVLCLQDSIMKEKELLAVISLPGRYEVITREDGSFIVIPVPPDAILISNDSHIHSVIFFRQDKD